MKNIIRLYLPVLLCLVISSQPFAAEIPGHISAAVNHPYRSAEDRQRDKTSKPGEVLSFFGVTPDMHVLDFLSGGGYYSEILSHIVGDKGRIVAHTNKAYGKFVGDQVKKRFADNRLAKVNRLTMEVPVMDFGEGTYDMILAVMNYHDIYYVADYWPEVDRERYFKTLHKALKPGGILAIVDHSAAEGTGEKHAQDLHRIDERFAIRDIESAGFELDGKSEVLRNADDDRSKLVFDDGIRGKTDRFVHRYIKK